MENIELDDEMEMPTPCQHCGEWFDLNDGYGSEKWHKGIVICKTCHNAEEKEIERDEEIEELKNNLSDAEITIRDVRKRLAELGALGNVSKNESNCNLPHVMCRAGDYVKEAGSDWIKVLNVKGRNIYLDEGDGLNCLDVDDVIAWKHGT